MCSTQKSRNRSQTAPERPTNIPPSGTQTLGQAPGYTSPPSGTQTLGRTPSYTPQSSFPPISSPSSQPRHGDHPRGQPTPPGYNTVGHVRGLHTRYGYGHQESEHDVEYVSEELLSDKGILDGQSERYQMIAEVMKRNSSEYDSILDVCVCVCGRGTSNDCSCVLYDSIRCVCVGGVQAMTVVVCCMTP